MKKILILVAGVLFGIVLGAFFLKKAGIDFQDLVDKTEDKVDAIIHP